MHYNAHRMMHIDRMLALSDGYYVLHFTQFTAKSNAIAAKFALQVEK